MAQQTTRTAEEQPADDLEAIRQVVLDYIQGWYEGDAQRMRRCLHSELAKHALVRIRKRVPHVSRT